MPRPLTAIYVRISKDRDDQMSTEIQEQRCREYAHGRGWSVARVYADVGRSAFKRNVNRPQLDELLSDADTGTIGAIIVYRLDRLARSVADFATMWRRLEAAGCEFVSVSEQFDTSTAMGRAMVQIALVFAELESGIRSERITDWHRARTAAGKPHSGPSPYGYTREWAVDDTEAAHLRRAAQLVLMGDPLLSIVRDLNTAEVPPPGKPRSGGRHEWSAATLKRSLLRPAIAGLREIDGALVAGGWDPILGRAEWEQVGRALTDPARKVNHRGTDRRHLLSGFITCGNCGAELYASARHRDGRVRYACRKRAGRVDACQAVSIDGPSTDTYVVGLATAALDGVTVPAPSLTDAGPPWRAAVLESVGLQAELDELARLLGEGEIDRSEWLAAAEPLRRRKHQAEEREQQAPQPPPSDLDLSAFARLSASDQHRVLRWLFASIVVAPHDRSRPRNLAAAEHRVSVTWRV